MVLGHQCPCVTSLGRPTLFFHIAGPFMRAKVFAVLFMASMIGGQPASATEYPVLGYLAATDLECPAGTWVKTWLQSGHNVYQCTPCSEGRYNRTAKKRDDATQTESCNKALKGYYVDVTGATEPTQCPAGSRSRSSEGKSVSACSCEEGYYSATGRAPCTIAAPGHYVNGKEKKAQTPCKAGTYAAGEGNKACVTATAGHFVANAAADAQTPCQAGTYASGTRSIACTAASAGNYVPEAGATAQIKCPTGTYTSGTSTVSCTSFGAGTTTATGNVSQTACLYDSPADYYNFWGGKPAPGTKSNSPHKCKDGKNWKKSKQACQ